MENFLIESYPWVKSLHIISVIAWMSGMLYLPRIYVYHADAEPGSDKSETFKIMERRLLRGIINPAMIMTIILGVILIGIPGVVNFADYWIWVKLALVTAMGAFHGNLSKWRKDFERDVNTRSAKFYRMVNEIPTVLLILIVFLVVVKPF